MIVAEKFDYKTSGAVQDQVQADNSAFFPFLFCVKQQDKSDDKISGTHYQLRRDKLRAVGRVHGVFKDDAKGGISFAPVTAAGQEAADPAEALSQRHRRRKQVQVRKKASFFNAAVYYNRGDAGDDPAVNDESVSRQDEPGVGDYGLYVDKAEEELGADEAEDQDKQENSEDLIRIKPSFFRPVLGHKNGAEDAEADHQAVAVDGDAADCKYIVVHFSHRFIM